MRSRVLIVGVVAAALVALGGQTESHGAVGDCTPQQSWGTLMPSVESQVIALVNAHRVAMGLNALAPATSLVASAEWKSMDMAGYQYMDHNDPAPVARSIGDRFAACGYPTNAAWGENIAYGFLDAQSVMDAWLSDVGHKANIENTSWTTIGVGVAQASNGLIFWTQDFGTTGAAAQPPPENDTQPPTAPTALTGAATSGTAVSLNWHASSDNYGVAGYDVYLNGTKLGTTGVTTSNVGGLSCGTTYTLGVDAYDLSGNTSPIASTSITTQSCSGGSPPPSAGDTQPPSVPGSIAIGTITQTTAELSWQASGDDTGVAGYTLYLNGTATGTVSGLSGAFSGLTCGTTYTVGVDAFDAAGNHSTPLSTSITTDACTTDDQPPSIPVNVTATPASRQAVVLSWERATDDIKVTGYTVYADGSVFKTTGPYATGARVNTLACGATHTFAVDAFDAAGNHSAAVTVTAATLPCRTTTTSG